MQMLSCHRLSPFRNFHHSNLFPALSLQAHPSSASHLLKPSDHMQIHVVKLVISIIGDELHMIFMFSRFPQRGTLCNCNDLKPINRATALVLDIFDASARTYVLSGVPFLCWAIHGAFCSPGLAVSIALRVNRSLIVPFELQKLQIGVLLAFVSVEFIACLLRKKAHLVGRSWSAQAISPVHEHLRIGGWRGLNGKLEIPSVQTRVRAPPWPLSLVPSRRLPGRKYWKSGLIAVG